VDGADERTGMRPHRDDAPARHGGARPTGITKEKGGGMTTATSCRCQRDVTRVPPVSGCCPNAVGGGVR
jgi:hypothetical protein